MEDQANNPCRRMGPAQIMLFYGGVRLHFDLNSLHTQQFTISRLAATVEKAGYFTSSMRLSQSAADTCVQVEDGPNSPKPMGAQLPTLSPPHTAPLSGLPCMLYSALSSSMA